MMDQQAGDRRETVEDDVRGLFARLGTGGAQNYLAFDHARLPEAQVAPPLPVTAVVMAPAAVEPPVASSVSPLRAVPVSEPSELQSPLMKTFQRLLQAEASTSEGPLKQYFSR